MPNSHLTRWVSVVILLACLSGALLFSSCEDSQRGPLAYDAKAGNLTMTGPQIIQYNLIHFDTAAAERTLTLPSAADIVSALSVSASSFTAIVVTADGGSDVKINGGAGVTVKPSAASVATNTTKTIFLVLENVGSGSQSVIVY